MNTKETALDPGSTFALTSTKKALLVEDNATNQLVALKILESIGFVVTIAQDGLQALHRVKEQEYDIIFMDLQMPNMDGFEASLKIRDLDIDTPLIALSAAVIEEDTKQKYKTTIDGYLTKPIDQEALYTLLGRYFELNIIAKENEHSNIPALIDGVNIQSVIETFGEDEQSVYRMYLDFAKDYKDIESKLQNIDSQEYKAHIHHLKGVSGNLKMDRLHTLATQIHDNHKVERTYDLIKETNRLTQQIQTKITPLIKLYASLDQQELQDEIKWFIDALQEYRFISSHKEAQLIHNLQKQTNPQVLDQIKEEFDAHNNKKLIKLLKQTSKELYENSL